MNCRKNEPGKILSEWRHFFGCNFSPYVFWHKSFRQPPPSFPECCAFWVASNICSCKTPSSSPLFNSSLIQKIKDATILEVLGARNICLNFENACIKIVPSWFISLAQELRLYGAKLVSLRVPLSNMIFSKSLVWNSSNLFNSQISKIADNVFLGIFLSFIGRNACYFFSINRSSSITTVNGLLHPLNTY